MRTDHLVSVEKTHPRVQIKYSQSTEKHNGALTLLGLARSNLYSIVLHKMLLFSHFSTWRLQTKNIRFNFINTEQRHAVLAFEKFIVIRQVLLGT